MHEDRRGAIGDALLQAAREMAEIWLLRRRQIQKVATPAVHGQAHSALHTGAPA
jgi:hypothetical protein